MDFCGRSTVTQLLCYLDKCVKAIVEGNVVDTVYLDFMKAFDTVPHMRLMGKLKAYGVEGNIAKWITEYLNNRSQVVVVTSRCHQWNTSRNCIRTPTVCGIHQRTS